MSTRPLALSALVDAGHTALVTSEMQRGVVGENAIFPALAQAARSRSLVANAARLCEAARLADVPVIHGCAVVRPGRVGANTNARIFAAAARSPVQLLAGSEAAALVPELGDTSRDLILTRTHGLNPMARTDLAPTLENLGVTSLVVCGVSVNVAITNLVMDAVNAGFRVVVPRDAVVGIPLEYGDAVVANTLGVLAELCTTQDLVEIWTT